MARQVSVSEAAALMKAGWRYLDVRSIPEFEAGHPQGAANVPLLHAHAGRLVPNPDFHAVVAANFAPADQLLVGCKTAGRAAQAAAQLEAAGFTNVALVRGGYVGERDPFGRVEATGWLAAGLPTSQQAAPGLGYAELAAKK
jgi:rhodanese-related sulfurtransferase